MRIEGSHRVALPRDEVWRRLDDPEVLRACAPGLEKLEAAGDDRFEAVLEVKVPAITGRFEGSIDYLERLAPEFQRFRLQGKGPLGFVDGEVELRLTEDGDATECGYAADMQVGGQVGRLGQRMLSGVSKEMAGQLFDNLESHGANGPGEVATASVGQSFFQLVWRSLLRFLGLRRDD